MMWDFRLVYPLTIEIAPLFGDSERLSMTRALQVTYTHLRWVTPGLTHDTNHNTSRP